MKTGIHIGHSGTEGLAGLPAAVAKAIDVVFRSARINRIDQVTLQKALEAVIKSASIDYATIRDCVIGGGKTVNMYAEKDES